MRRAIGRASARTRSGASAPFGQDSKGNVREVRNILHRGSFWDYGMVGHGQDSSADTGHPATFAERFARDAVDVWSNPGDLVVDPFAGSATVGRACEDLGRRFIGSERVPKYHAIGMQRLAQRGLFAMKYLCSDCDRPTWICRSDPATHERRANAKKKKLLTAGTP